MNYMSIGSSENNIFEQTCRVQSKQSRREQTRAKFISHMFNYFRSGLTFVCWRFSSIGNIYTMFSLRAVRCFH